MNVGVRGRQFLTPGAYQACVYVSLLTRVCVVYMLVCTYACMGVRGRQEKEGGGGALECAGACAVRERLPAGALVYECVWWYV